MAMIPFSRASRLLVWAMCLSLAPSCRSQGQENYTEEVYISGRLGGGSDELPDTMIEGESFLSGVIAIAPDGSVFIDDPAKRVIKRFSPPGKLIATISLPDLSIDNIVIVDSSLIAVSYWNRPYIDLMNYYGQIRDSIPMPGGGGCQSDLFLCGDGLFLRYCAWFSETQPYQGYHWSLSGELLKREVDSIGLWAETCGQYYASLQTAFGIEDTATIVSLVCGTQFRVGKRLNPVGMDGKGNLYVEWEQRIGPLDSARYRYWILKFSNAGKRLAQFEVRYFSADHRDRVEEDGAVFILDQDQANSEWRIYRYSKN